MAQQNINTDIPNSGNGDNLRDAFVKTQANFTELYTNKVDKISGKVLSTNDYTTTEKNKLEGIPANAEKNVQADWLDNDPDSDSFILNKPDVIGSVNWGQIDGTLSGQEDLQNALDGKQNISEKDSPNGYAGLDVDGKILLSQLPDLTGTTVTTYWSAGTGTYSVATVNGDNIALGNYSVAEGFQTSAITESSHSEGENTQAGGQASHAEGQATITVGLASHAEGSGTFATGHFSHSEGYQSQATGYISHAQGNLTVASGDTSHAEGDTTIAGGESSHAEGNLTIAFGRYSHAEGRSTKTNVSADTAHAEGSGTTAGGKYSHAEGINTQALGIGSHAQGSGTITMGFYSHAGGIDSTANGTASFVHGTGSTVNGDNSIVLGSNITGTTDNTTFVDILSIKTAGSYADDAAADADALLPSGGLYTLTGSRAVYRKP